MKRMAMATAAAALVMGSVAWSQGRDALPAGCRQEILALCRGQGGTIRDCLRAAMPQLGDSCRKAMSDRGVRSLPEGFIEERYGTDAKQTLAIARPVVNRTVPLLVFVHGGGWSIGDKSMSVGTKAEFAMREGWALATVNYRLVPNATVEQQAADVASAVAWLRAHAVSRGFEGDRIVLMGHSAGAHLAALVGTDPRYLKAAGVPMSAVKGVVLLDGAGYDVPAQMADKGNRVSGMYDAAFGNEVGRQRALSPTFQAAAPNVASWLILPVERRADSRAQSQGLAAALTRAGASATVVPIPGESHMTLNRGLGEKDDMATDRIAAFLRSLR